MGFKKKARDKRQKHLKEIARIQKELIEAFEAQGGEVIKHHIFLDEDNEPISVPHIKLPVMKMEEE